MIFGDSPDFAFVVNIDPAKRIDDLKSVIKERRPDVFGDSPAVNMVLWKVDIPLDVANEKLSALERRDSKLCIETVLGGEKLRVLQRIGKAFPAMGDDETVRVLIERAEDSSSSPVKTLKRSASLIFDEVPVGDGFDVTEGLIKRRRLAAPSSVKRQNADLDIFAGHVLSQGSVVSRNLAEEIREKGLDYYYDSGKSASSNVTWSIAKIDETLRVQRLFFQFQRERGEPEEWPEDGLPIGMIHFVLRSDNSLVVYSLIFTDKKEIFFFQR